MTSGEDRGLSWQIGAWDDMAETCVREIDRRFRPIVDHLLARDEPDDDVTRERIEAFNEAIAAQAEDYDVQLVDLYGEEVEDDLVSNRDGFHPNNEGHRQIADRFLEVILPVLGL